MKTVPGIPGLLLLLGIVAGCTASEGGGEVSGQPDYYRNLGSCNNSGLGAGYSRDYSYGDRYATGQTRRC